ncbi:MAG TPA: DotU family type IV/VI secretion system protein [Terriglobales bacterium]|nr:DotU family type IV/VI secretion system protein [Terriglobales bacterium]
MAARSSPDEPFAPEAGPPGDPQGPSESLALLYQSLLTGIVRLKSERQHITDGDSFRRRSKAALQEVERVAVAAGYDGHDVRDTHFAVVAFLDAVLLHSKDPVRAEWERMPLALEIFGYADAGVVFFDKLDQLRSRRDSERLAEIMEVYLLCLLLGFEGRYSGRRGELEGITEGLRMRIDHIRRRGDQLSPSGLPPASAAPAPRAERRDRLRLVTLAVVIFTLLCFALLRLNLVFRSEEVSGKLF